MRSEQRLRGLGYKVIMTDKDNQLKPPYTKLHVVDLDVTKTLHEGRNNESRDSVITKALAIAESM